MIAVLAAGIPYFDAPRWHFDLPLLGPMTLGMFGPTVALGVLIGMPEGSRVVHVHGSAQGDPAQRVASWRAICEPRVGYTSVALGRVRGGSSFRWLTHEEICDGVLRAWRTQRDVAVGELASPD